MNSFVFHSFIQFAHTRTSKRRWKKKYWIEQLNPGSSEISRAHHEELLEKAKDYRESHSEEIKDRRKTWYESNKARVNERRRKDAKAKKENALFVAEYKDFDL